jgi:DNA-binding FadR family transcriptional regulator
VSTDFSPANIDIAVNGRSAKNRKNGALVRLRALLSRSDVQAGGRLPPERELAERMGMSRRAVRTALDALEAEGWITRQQGRGTLISEGRTSLDVSAQLASLTNPVDALEARLAIEPALARLAALRGTQADFDKLFEAAEASRSSKEPLAYEKADAAFHRRIAMAARNPVLLTIFDAVMHVHPTVNGDTAERRRTASTIRRATRRRIARLPPQSPPETRARLKKRCEVTLGRCSSN